VSDGTAPPGESGTPEESGSEHNPLDVLIFAPVGLVMTAVEDLPGLIDKGRHRVELEISNARVMGRLVVTAGQKEVAQHLSKLWSNDTAAPTTPGPSDTRTTRTTPPPAAAPKPVPDPADTEMVERTFAGYDTLSASQVVRRLESLDADLLRAVQRYEASHRNRRTVLSRTQQLLDGDSPPAAPPRTNGSAQ
jgi:hypothetical protein